MTLKSNLCIIQVILKYKTDADSKDEIKLYMFPLIEFNPYYYP